MAKVQFIPTRDCGAYDGNRKYRMFDQVQYGASDYVLIVPEMAGRDPGNTDFWIEIEEVVEPLDASDGLALSIRERIGNGVISGLAISAQGTPDLTVAMTEGVCYLPSGLRIAASSIAALTVATVEALKNRKAIIYVSSLGVVTALSAFGTTAVAGAKTYTITTNAVATDTIVFVGVTFTAVASGATGNQFNVGADAAATAANLAAVVGANATVAAKYAVTVDGAAITLTEKTPGGGYTPANATKTGTIVVTNGAATTSVAAGAATAPALPSGGVLLAEIAVAAGATTIAAGNITKKRKMLVSDAVFKTE